MERDRQLEDGCHTYLLQSCSKNIRRCTFKGKHSYRFPLIERALDFCIRETKSNRSTTNRL